MRKKTRTYFGKSRGTAKKAGVFSTSRGTKGRTKKVISPEARKLIEQTAPPAIGARIVAGRGASLAAKELARHGKFLKDIAAKRISAGAGKAAMLKMAREGDKAIRRSRKRPIRRRSK